ncbi:MAG: UvrD-helicase domain-containing protein, partial [Oscillospiraceae bacterium]
MQINQESFNEIKRTILKNRFTKMNDMQKKAIFKVNGPVLILAGAGSGKTTVLVNRIANMLNFGDAYNNDYISEYVTNEDYDYLKSIENSTDYDVECFKDAIKVNAINPWNVLAITFTNKAANELKGRLQSLLGDVALNINAGTFHCVCLKILRREITRLGYSSSFTIYDTDDSVRTIKDCLSDLAVDDKMFPPKAMLGEISRSKDAMISPAEYLAQNEQDFRKKVIGNIFTLYQKKLKSSNAVDFDDIICLTVRLLLEFPDVLQHYQNLFKYVLVDEYQDTNHVQYKLVTLLSQKSKNICVVGDDDQSIYKFRGATIENILNFEKEFEDATVIRLEQNYRSTQNILDAANGIIKNNTERKG